MIFKLTINGILGSIALIVVYFITVTLVSSWSFAIDQFSRFWYFIITLAIGFGIQIGFYIYLRNAIHHKNASGKVVAATGVTSTAAMISCCAHYLVNILPILGFTGLISIVSQYQIRLFWIGIMFNIVGIAYIGSKIIKFSKQ